jgi:hypothetical protein
MRFKVLSFLALWTALCVPAHADWKELKGDHFIVYYLADESFAKQVAHDAEIYYNRIADELGYPRYSNFWQWENRAKVYIHDTAENFRKATGEPDWSHGVAMYSKKEIHSFTASEGFLDGILPHEIAHLIFRDFVGYKGVEVPIWLDEGVAQWEEPQKRQMAKRVSKWLIHFGKDMAVQDLTATDVRSLKDQEKVDFFYMQSVSIVDFLITKYGARSFTDFCRALRDGKSFNEALRGSFVAIENLAELDLAWRRYVHEDPVPELEYYS